MKTRYGHVSNSSSSSFIIAFKPVEGVSVETRDEKMAALMHAFLGGHTDVPAATAFVEPIASFLVEAAFTDKGWGLDSYLRDWDNEKKWAEENGEEHKVYEDERIVRKALADGWVVGMGSASYNEHDSMGEAFVGNSAMTIETDTIYFKSDGGG